MTTKILFEYRSSISELFPFLFASLSSFPLLTVELWALSFFASRSLSSFPFCLSNYGHFLFGFLSSIYIAVVLYTGEEEPNDDERFALISSLKKVSIFYNCHDMGKWNIWDGLLEVSRMMESKCFGAVLFWGSSGSRGHNLIFLVFFLNVYEMSAVVSTFSQLSVYK